MIAGIDSAYPPSAASVAAAHADGVKLWNGYFAGPNILHGWSQADFDRVRVLGGTPIAYASGYSPPQTLKAQAAAWNVRLCLDVEGGIRPDGTWVQPWLDESGAGLYGNQPVHNGRHAVFHVLAAYPASGDPHATWGAGRPPGPCGWQWHGSISRYGANVDLCWFDDWFAGAVTGVTGGSRMFAFRPGDGDRHDSVLVVGGHLHHYWSNNIANDATAGFGQEDWGAPAGKTLVAGTEWVAWDSPATWMAWGCQASDGSQWFGWGNISNGNVSGWKSWSGVVSDLPTGGTPGATGPPGPAGPAGTVPAHSHTVATTTTDTP